MLNCKKKSKISFLKKNNENFFYNCLNFIEKNLIFLKIKKS